MNNYPYSQGELLKSPQHYMYTPYVGATFIRDWLESREYFLSGHLSNPNLCTLTAPKKHSEAYVSTEATLNKLCLDLRNNDYTSDYCDYWLPRLLKKFEVSKRLYAGYEVEVPHAKIVDTGYHNLNLYLLLAEAVIRAWAIKPQSQYVNALLKLVDTLLSQSSSLDKQQLAYLTWVVSAERIILAKMMNSLDIEISNDVANAGDELNSLTFLQNMSLPCQMQEKLPEGIIDSNNSPDLKTHKRFKKILMLCGHTSRSVAYIQAMKYASIKPDSVVVYGAPRGKPSSARELNALGDTSLFSPDLNLDVLESLSDANWPYEITNATELSDPRLISLIEQTSPDVIIYSGYGGQLVPASILQHYPVLHIHSGWLPDYRGSTTLYYQIIDEHACAASAILLDEQIDTGDIVMRKRYPIPTAGLDVDYLYDNMIRADLVVETLKKWQDPTQILQKHRQATAALPYFIIHPLLKHLAILTIDKTQVNDDH